MIVLRNALLFLLVLCLQEAIGKQQYRWDDMGYVLYCPCMGRFGNQAAHFLGALNFAKRLNRTLALPPWRSYAPQGNVPYTEWFQLEPVQSYHKSLPMEDFLSQLAPQKWPPGRRTGYCYSPTNPESHDCEMKNGNPFGPFWTDLGVNFDSSEFSQLGYDVDDPSTLKIWQERYPPDKHPVLAFKGAPATFPVLRHHRHLQRYVLWSDKMNRIVEDYITKEMKAAPFIGVHMRIGVDWESACEHAIGQPSFMESGQCLEDRQGAKVTQELCLPSTKQAAKQISAAVRRTGHTSVYIATDAHPDFTQLQAALGSKVKLYHLNPDEPPVDLAMLGRAAHFIGNCVSSFSAFVKRERDALGKTSEFWGLPYHGDKKKMEL
ncbi:hypothetical protein EMCRGX_G011394 [Ephydatia muelleri]